MSDLNFELLPWQQEVWTAGCRFNVVAAGRRSGKTRLAIYQLLYHALQLEKGHVWYVAPTQGAARDILWDELLDLGKAVITKAHINNLQVTLINGAKITLKGADRPETLRGVSLKFLVLDEYATMKPETWDTILRPALADQMGPALFIGTPAGRNHFYDMFNSAGGICAVDGKSGGRGGPAYWGEDEPDPDWTAWHFTSYDNPFVPKEEIAAAKRSMSTFAFQQEFCASFNVSGSEQFKEDWMRYSSLKEWDLKRNNNSYYIACDLAGFEELQKKNSTARLDDSAIVIAKCGSAGWYVEDIICGRWTLKMTAEKIFNAVREYQPLKVGIEKGISKQAVMSPLEDLMRRTGRYFRVEELTHGNRKKTDRIMWALQGNFEHGRITLPPDAKWLMKFLDQLYSFPNKMVHDDMIDALAYIEQLVSIIYDDMFEDGEDDEWNPFDDIAGY